MMRVLPSFSFTNGRIMRGFVKVIRIVYLKSLDLGQILVMDQQIVESLDDLLDLVEHEVVERVDLMLARRTFLCDWW
jgi:hypothetical protein